MALIFSPGIKVAAPTPTPAPSAFTPSKADYYENMSALSKAIRLREYEHTLFRFAHLVRRYPENRFSVGRRLLISSGEDCISPAVQIHCANKYTALLSQYKADTLTYIGAGVELLHPLLKSPNWWTNRAHATATAVHAHIYSIEIDVPPGFYEISHAKDLMQALLRQPDAVHRFAAIAEHFSDTKMSVPAYANWLKTISRPETQALLDVINLHSKELKSDGNHLFCVFVNAMLKPDVDNTVHSLSHEEARSIAETALKCTDVLRPIPDYCLDGVHTRRGKDRRFAGIPENMLACSRAYMEYGALTNSSVIKDEWQEPASAAAKMGFSLPSKIY